VDAAMLGFKTTVRTDLCRGIDLSGSMQAALEGMADAGVTIL
jgi:nicotinamidase/pyrazinamidase